MATTMITGASGSVTGSSTGINTDRKVIDISDTIYLLQPDSAPLYVFGSKLRKSEATQSLIKWFEDDLNPSWSTLASSCASGDGTINVASGTGAYFNKYDLVKAPSTGEVFLVTDVNTDALTAKRGYGTTTAAAIAASADVVIIGSAFEEGSPASHLVTKSTQVSTVPNYLQIFRKSVEITKTLANTKLYGESDRAYQRRKKGIEIMRDFERAFLFGEPLEDTATKDTSVSFARRTTGGINYFVGTNGNSTGANGTLSESTLETWLRSFFKYGSSSRMVFASSLVISAISGLARSKLEMIPRDKTYGIAITQYLSPHGTLNLIHDKLLENGTGATYFGGYAFAIEMDDVLYRYLTNRDVTFETNIQASGDDSYKDQYICEIGMEFHNCLKHGRLTGVTG